MQSHLDAGCAKCSQALSLWQRSHQVAHRTSELQPTDAALRSVRNAFVEQRAAAARVRAPKAARTLELLFDSFRTPVLAGVRSSANHSRQLLYGSATYRIDVRIEPQIDTENVVLIGQILNSSDPHERLAEVPVTVWKARKILAESMTNRQGEFQIECAMDSSFRLAIKLPGQREVSVPLIEPVAIQDAEVTQLSESNKLKVNSRDKKKSTRKKE